MEREKTRKKALQDKAASATTQLQQQRCFKALEEFAQRNWSKSMGKVFFPIKLREKLARRAARIWCVLDLEEELKPDCLLKTSILWPFKDKLVILISLAVATISPHSEHEGFNITVENVQPQRRPKARPPLQDITLNIEAISSPPIQKKRRRPKKTDRSHVQGVVHDFVLDFEEQEKTKAKREQTDRPHVQGVVHDFVLDLEEQEKTKAKRELQKRDNDVQVKKRKTALAQRDNLERIKKQRQKKN